MIYLDNASTTQIAPGVLDAMMPYLKEQYGNPGTIYELGRKALNAVSVARKQVADFIGAKPEQIIFTSGGTEANNLAVYGVMYNNFDDRIVVSRVEHDSVLRAVDYHANPIFINVDNNGVVSTKDVERVLNKYQDSARRNKIRMVSVMYVNNETGSVNPIKEIATLCKRYGALFHTDCVQAAGCQPIDVKKIGCDFLSISSHKIHGVKGVGALFVRDKSLLPMHLIYGGASQEFGLRGGTENVAGIVGFGKACELAMYGREEYEKTVLFYKKSFFDILIKELKKDNLDEMIKVNGETIQSGSGKTLNLLIRGVDAETLVLMMDSQGGCISAGAACKSHESKPSHVLLAMGLTPGQARSSIRISFSDFNTYDEIEKAACILANCIKNLRGQYDG